MNLSCRSSNITIHYDSLLPSILAHFLQLINLVGNNLPDRHQPDRGSLYSQEEGSTVCLLLCENIMLAIVWPRSTAALSLLNVLFTEQGKNHLAKKWRILQASEQRVPNPNAASLGAEKSWLVIATAIED